jgi:hypothetical protein
MDTELPKTLISTSDTTGKLAASLGEFITLATKLKGDLLSASAALSTVHKNVLSQPPGALEPASPVAPVPPKPPVAAAKPVEPVKPVETKPVVDFPHSSTPER